MVIQPVTRSCYKIACKIMINNDGYENYGDPTSFKCGCTWLATTLARFMVSRDSNWQSLAGGWHVVQLPRTDRNDGIWERA